MALAQSVKLSWFERLVDECIADFEQIPHTLAMHGSVRMSRSECLKAIGRLFHVVESLHDVWL